MKKTGACKMAGDCGSSEVVSRYLKDAEEQGSAMGGEEEEEEEEEEEKKNPGVEGDGDDDAAAIAIISSSGDGSPAASAYEVIDGTLYRKRLERGATSYTEVLVGAAAEQRSAVIASFHQQQQQPAVGQRHCTMEETYKNVSENYWWEGMFPDIRDYVQGCKQCKDKRDNPLISEEKHITRKLTSHCSKVLERLNSQRSKGLFCDVTLIVEKTPYPAHRAVLAAVSEYFHDLFSEKGTMSNKVVDLKGFSSISFLPLLEFSYTSTLSVKLDYFAETSALARHLRIWDVVEICAALCKLHGTGNSKAYKEEPNKEEKKEFSSYEVCIDQSLIGSRQHVSDLYYRFGQLEDGPAQQKQDKFGRNVFSPISHSPVIQGEIKVPDFTLKLQEMQSGLFKDKMAPVHSESCFGNLGMETLENPSRRFKLLGQTPSKKLKVKSDSPQRCSAANKALNNIPTSFEPKFVDTSRNVYHQRKSNLEKSPIKSKSRSRASKHLDHNNSGPQDNSGSKGVNTLLRSPVRQVATEEELYSPNTTEKYKLLSVLGLQRKTSTTDGEEQASWKQKRRLRQAKVRNYSLATGTRKQRIKRARSQLQQDQIKAKGLANCFVVIEKILPMVQKQKEDNQQLNKTWFALKSEPLNCKINVSPCYTGKEVVCSPAKIQINNPQVKIEGWNSLLDKKIQPENNCSATKKSQRQTNSSISKTSVKNKLSVSSAEVAVSSKTQPRKSGRCALYDMSVKCSSSLGSTAAKLSPCLMDHGHIGRRTRQSFKSMVNCRKCKLKNLDYMPNCPKNAAQKRLSKRTLLKNELLKNKLLDGHNFHGNQKLFSDDICAAGPAKRKEKQVMTEKLLNQLPARDNVGKLKRQNDGKTPVPKVCQNIAGVGKERKATPQLNRRRGRNEQLNLSRLRTDQGTKKQEQLKTVSRNPKKQILITSSKTQVKRKVSSTGCRYLGAENQNYLQCIKTVLGKRKRTPTQKIIEAGLSFGFLLSQKKDKINRLPDQTKSKQLDLSPSRMIRNNSATETKTPEKVKSKITTPNDRATVRRRNCNTTEHGFGQRKLPCSEASGRMKEIVTAKIKRIKPVALYGKKLLNLNIKNTLVKKATKRPNPKANNINKKTQLSTSQKAMKLRVASASSKFTGSKSLPKNLQGAAQKLKKMQPKCKETLKLTARRKYIGEESMKKTKVSGAHTCHECSTTFTNCDTLFLHRIRHSGGRRWPCLLCDKFFHLRKNIQVHLRSHSEKLYKCKLCIAVSKKAKSLQSKRK
ncbi:uncharacterized protein LOC116980327 isoform X2 [Amblyraja radiata]|uniref:uncharacterized protein LOC116980327 isoform X2 n=1 Tax=Amblyraja radiata TaxID=386614 RepID=UPI001403F48E|nr:uncharacterized protein LOC116980327 isoform X2 [Amblyraja radiata]